jgi:hypothetical protein
VGQTKDGFDNVRDFVMQDEVRCAGFVPEFTAALILASRRVGNHRNLCESVGRVGNARATRLLPKRTVKLLS